MPFSHFLFRRSSPASNRERDSSNPILGEVMMKDRTMSCATGRIVPQHPKTTRMPGIRVLSSGFDGPNPAHQMANSRPILAAPGTRAAANAPFIFCGSPSPSRPVAYNRVHNRCIYNKSGQSAACGSRPRRAYRPYRRRGRVAEGGGLLNRYRVVKPYRGFESLRLRQSMFSRVSCIFRPRKPRRS